MAKTYFQNNSKYINTQFRISMTIHSAGFQPPPSDLFR